MFENEGNEIESTQPDVSQDPSSEGQIESQPGQQEAAPQKQEEVPFHEHPRWKEVMEERNAERQRSQALEQQIAAMQRQFQEMSKPKQEPAKDPMYERLMGIDPDFAGYLKETREQASLAKQLQEELSNLRHEQFVSQAMGKFSELNKTNGVSPELADLYLGKLDLAVRSGEIKDVASLEKAYNAMHSATSKFLEARDRASIEKYTSSKKTDAKAPATTGKAKAPTSSSKVEFSKDPNEARAQRAKLIAAALKAGREH